MAPLGVSGHLPYWFITTWFTQHLHRFQTSGPPQCCYLFIYSCYIFHYGLFAIFLFLLCSSFPNSPYLAHWGDCGWGLLLQFSSLSSRTRISRCYVAPLALLLFVNNCFEAIPTETPTRTCSPVSKALRVKPKTQEQDKSMQPLQPHTEEGRRTVCGSFTKSHLLHHPLLL